MADPRTATDPAEGYSTTGTIQVEVMPNPAAAGDLGPSDMLERFNDRAYELGTAIGAISERLRSALERRLTDDGPGAFDLNQVTVELAVNLEAETGVVICKGKTGAAFKVALTWQRRKPQPPA